MTLVLETDSAIEPVAVEDLRDYLHIAHAVEDGRLEKCIKGARLWCEDVTGRQFITASWKLLLDSFPSEIELHKVPVNDVTHVKYYNLSDVQTTLVEGTDYEVDEDSEPGRIRPLATASWYWRTVGSSI